MGQCFSFFVHCISSCFALSLSGSTLFIVLNGFGVSGLKRNSNHKLERRDDPFKLRENGTNGFGAETQPQPQTILKSKRKTVCGVKRKRKHRESQICATKRDPNATTRVVLMARCCTRCGARLTYATTPRDSRRSIGTGTSSWSYRTHDAV